MKFSIILCTYGRNKVIFDFIKSLSEQNYKNFELIIIDQNIDNSLLKNINIYNKYMSIKYIRSLKGLSRSRNVGLSYATGDILCFPDDDCTYPSELLKNINDLFRYNLEVDFLLGRAIERDTEKIIAGKKITKSMVVNCKYFGGSSITLFINRKRERVKFFCFDEEFGMGATFPSEEENDLVMRMLQNGKKGLYMPEKNYVFHPDKDSNYFNLKRAGERGYGFGALVAKHILSTCGMSYFLRYFLIRVPVSIVFNVIAGNIRKSKYNLVKYLNMWRGFSFYIFTFSLKIKK